MKKLSLLTTMTMTLLTLSPAWAIFCPNNFSQINPGDSVDSVKQICGKPDAEKTYTAEQSKPQQWTYYLQLSLPLQGTIAMSVAFVQDKAISITVNGVGASTTPICGGTIKLGDSTKAVKAACGNPVIVSETTTSPEDQLKQDAANKMTEITYNSNPPVTLVFKAGLLQASSP